MRGDHIVLGEQQRNLGKRIVEKILLRRNRSKNKSALAVAGESGSGKSTTAAAIAAALTEQGIVCVVLQQDDYYVYPPKTNDRTRRENPAWHGVQEVNLQLLDQHIQEILNGQPEIQKPLALYDEDRFVTEPLRTDRIQVVIAEGSYVTLLQNVQMRIFIERTYLDTRANREQRARYQAELDAFTENILRLEHNVISAHKARADLIVTKEYEIVEAPKMS